MSTLTRAAVLRASDAPYSIENVTLADPGPDEVLIRLAGVGFCHTDAIPRAFPPLLPIVLGHEGSGHVVRSGGNVSDIHPGDAVVLSFASCGRCRSCRNAVPAYCTSFLGLNMTGRTLTGDTSATDSSGQPIANRWFGQSSFAEYALVDRRGVVVVSEDLPIQILGPLGCGLQTGAGAVMNEMQLSPGQSIAVFGVGAVGLAAIMAAKALGAGDIIAVDLHESRLALATELGATRVVQAKGNDLATAVRGDSDGVDFALDTTSVGSVMESAIEVVAVGGKTVLIGGGMDSISLHPTALTGKHVTYVLEGGSNPQTFIPKLIQLWRDSKFPFDKLIRSYPFDEIASAEEDARTGATVKPILVFDGR